MPRPSVRDLIIAMGVVLVPILVVTWLFTNNLEDYPVESVDPAPVVAEARAEAPYPVLVPQNLPIGEGGWTITRAQWVAQGEPVRAGEGVSASNEWLWGALDPTGTYYAVNQSDGDWRRLVDDVSRGGVRDGTSTVGGQEWQRWISPDGRTRVLLREGGGYSVTVTADATYEGLEALASTLSTD